jgi:hypothetical protein
MEKTESENWGDAPPTFGGGGMVAALRNWRFEDEK